MAGEPYCFKAVFCDAFEITSCEWPPLASQGLCMLMSSPTMAMATCKRSCGLASPVLPVRAANPRGRRSCSSRPHRWATVGSPALARSCQGRLGSHCGPYTSRKLTLGPQSIPKLIFNIWQHLATSGNTGTPEHRNFGSSLGCSRLGGVPESPNPRIRIRSWWHTATREIGMEKGLI